MSQRVLDREVALEHFAYFPGAVVSAAVWRLLPEPFDDYRLLVLFCNLAMLAAALAFRGPLAVRLALGALLVCSPIAVRSAWFGQNDAPSLLLLVLAFALASRRSFGWAAASLAGAILLKQFAVVALPFLALMMWQMGAGRAELRRAGTGVRRGDRGGGAAVPDRRRGRVLRRHGPLRRRHLPDRGLRPVGHPVRGRGRSTTATAPTRSR